MSQRETSINWNWEELGARLLASTATGAGLYCHLQDNSCSFTEITKLTESAKIITDPKEGLQVAFFFFLNQVFRPLVL